MVIFQRHQGCPECGWPVPIVMFTGLCTDCSAKDYWRVREEMRALRENDPPLPMEAIRKLIEDARQG